MTATYDGQDRLLTYGAATFTYGRAGELRSRSEDGKTTSYTYDALGNLTSTQFSDGTQISYVVDAQGRRIGKARDGRLEQGFLWENQLRIAAETDGAGKVVSRFVYGDKANAPELIIKNEVLYRVITDHLGSPRLVASSTDGTVVQRIDYDEWGTTVRDSSPGFQPFGFAGGLCDIETGLVRYGARHYEPSVGRFTRIEPLLHSSPATIASNALLGVAMSPYSYGAGNPTFYQDPDGATPVPAKSWRKVTVLLMRLLGIGEKMAEHQGALGGPQEAAKALEKAKKATCSAPRQNGPPGGGRPPPDPLSIQDVLDFLDSISSIIVIWPYVDSYGEPYIPLPGGSRTET